MVVLIYTRVWTRSSILTARVPDDSGCSFCRFVRIVGWLLVVFEVMKEDVVLMRQNWMALSISPTGYATSSSKSLQMISSCLITWAQRLGLSAPSRNRDCSFLEITSFFRGYCNFCIKPRAKVVYLSLSHIPSDKA